MNGALELSWEAHCAGCERPMLGLAKNGTGRDAGDELRREGWGTRNLIWFCPSCLASMGDQSRD